MDRRKALMNLGVLTGGLMLLPSCDFSKEKITLALNNLKVNEKQEKLLKQIVKSLIPEGDLLGADALSVDRFVWVMVDDCLEEPVQKSFLLGLNNFEKQIKNIKGKDFHSLKPEEQIEAFIIISKEAKNSNLDIDQDVQTFLNTTKEFSIMGFMKSEYVMTEIMPYTLVPTTYGTCETIDKNERINING